MIGMSDSATAWFATSALSTIAAVAIGVLTWWTVGAGWLALAIAVVLAGAGALPAARRGRIPLTAFASGAAAVVAGLYLALVAAAQVYAIVLA
jgi:hypothetical protein